MASPPTQPEQAPAGSQRYSHDPLTGLPDEHLFRLRLPLDFARARERERNGALLVIILDNIIAVNEKYGRASGDEAIRAAANILQNVRASAGRESHLLFKIGGPLFAYYLPEASAPEARAVAEEIREKVLQSETLPSHVVTPTDTLALESSVPPGREPKRRAPSRRAR